MAIISDFQRVNSTVVRMCPLANGGFIIDTIPYNKNYINQSTRPRDVVGKEELAFDNMWVDEKKLQSNIYSVDYRPLQMNGYDISNDNTSLGKTYLQDPYETGVIYVLTSFPYAYESQTANNIRLYKLAEDGTVLTSINLNTILANYGYFKFADITKDYLVLKAYPTNGTYKEYFFKIRKDNLERVAGDGNDNLATVGTYGNTQIFHRDGTNMFVVNNIGANAGKMFYKVNHAVNPMFVAFLSSKDGSKLTNHDYNTTYTSFFTPKMANGYYYKVNAATSNANQPWKFEGFSLDTATEKIDVLPSSSITVEVDPKCHPDYLNLKNYNSEWYSSGIGARLFNTYKIDQDHFVTFFTMRMINGNNNPASLYSNNCKSYYILCKIDQADPKKIYIKNIQPMDDMYIGEPIKIAANKYMFFRPDTYGHMYKVDVQNYECHNVWEVLIPNCSQATWYNNRLWWLNHVTKELNFEVESDSRVVDIKFDKEEYVMNDNNDKQIGKLLVTVKQSDGTIVASKVKLHIYGPAVFQDNGNIDLEINTSAAGPTEVPFETTNGGDLSASATILPSSN